MPLLFREGHASSAVAGARTSQGFSHIEAPPSSRVAIVAGNAGGDSPWLFSVGARGFLSLADAEQHAAGVIAAERGAAS